MKIIVCLKETIDPVLNLDFGLTNRVVFREGLPFKLNTNDAASLVLALDMKNAVKDVEITLVSIGPERVERYLRNGLALGADKAIRIRDEGLDELSAYQKARILTQAIKRFGADLIFTGSRSLDTAHGQVGIFLAVSLDLPCVSEVVSIELDMEHHKITLVKDIGRGEREKVRCPLPAVVTVKGERHLPYASLDNLIDSQYSEISLFTLADLGITEEQLSANPSRIVGLVFPRPGPRKVPPLDSSLPAFERILQLLAGGIAKRRGLILQGGDEELAGQLFQLLKDEGVLKPATRP